MGITGILLILFSAALVLFSHNKVETVGAGLLITTSLFLIMIGIFHAGTYFHVFVSTYFNLTWQ